MDISFFLLMGILLSVSYIILTFSQIKRGVLDLMVKLKGIKLQANKMLRTTKEEGED